MQIKAFLVLLSLVALAGFTACKKEQATPPPSADSYRSMLTGSWTITQRGIDLDGDGLGEATEITALPPTLFSLMNFYADATGMVYIQDNGSDIPVDTAIHFTWHIPQAQKSIHLLIDGHRTVFADILKLSNIHLVLEYENSTGTREWIYLTRS